MKFGLKMLLLGMALALSGAGCGKKTELDPGTIKNLTEAYAEECNSAAQYSFLARKADEEKNLRASVLFRAMAQSENVHASRMAEAMKPFGIVPKAEIEEFKYTDMGAAVKSSIVDEWKALALRYPHALQQAKQSRAPQSVIEAFQYPLEAEQVHSRLLTELLNLPAVNPPPEPVLHVCLSCGYVTVGELPTLCPLCAGPRKKFKTFSGDDPSAEPVR